MTAPFTAFIPPRLTQKHWLAQFRDGERHRVDCVDCPSGWSPPFADRQLGVTAYHEAGHAVVAQITGKNPALATIVPEPEALGRVRCYNGGAELQHELAFHGDPYARTAGLAGAFTSIAYALAGPAVEYLWFEGPHPGEYFGLGEFDGDDDIIYATELGVRIFGNTEHAEEFYSTAAEWVCRFLNIRAVRVGLGRIAQRLQLHSTIHRAAIQAIPVVRWQFPLSEADLDRWAERVVSRAAEDKPKETTDAP